MKSLPEEVRLAEILRGYAPLGIAFSGGADSTALAVFASRVLNTGDVILIHAETPLAPGRESQLVRETAKRYSIPLKTVFSCSSVIESLFTIQRAASPVFTSFAFFCLRR